MDRLIDQFELRRGDSRRYDGFSRGLIVEKEARSTGAISPVPGGVPKDEYTLRVTLGVNFYSNAAQLAEARKVAERSLLAHLYGDTLNKLQRAEQAVWDGDPEAVLEALNDIRAMLTKG